MPYLSQESATLWNNVGNLALIFGAFLVLAGTWLTIWTGGQKERYADERLSGNEVQTQTAKAEAAKAIQETEKLRKNNLQLSVQLENEKLSRLQIEKGLASRKFADDKRTILIDALKSIQPRRLIPLSQVALDVVCGRS